MTTRIDPHQVLHQLFSPAFPVGAFAWSHGLEAAVQDGQVQDAASLQAWLEAVLRHGAGWSDAVAMAQAGQGADPKTLSELVLAMAPSGARKRETADQGAAFAATVNAVWGLSVPAGAYPVVAGCAVRALDLPLPDAVSLFLQAQAANLTSAAVRLVPLGQTDGQRVTRALLPLCADLAAAALTADLDDIGGFAPLVDIASQRQEAMTTRLFRS